MVDRLQCATALIPVDFVKSRPVTSVNQYSLTRGQSHQFGLCSETSRGPRRHHISHFLCERHAPLWILPNITALYDKHAAAFVSWPQFPVGAAAKEYNNLFHTAALAGSTPWPPLRSHVFSPYTQITCGWPMYLLQLIFRRFSPICNPLELNTALSNSLATLAPDPSTSLPAPGPVSVPNYDDNAAMKNL
eukprot:6193919-Pleurochrysis_carterae.AAC.1